MHMTAGTFFCIATRAVAWGRALASPSSAAFFAGAAGIIVATTFGSPMPMPFFAISGRRTHFVTVIKSRTFKTIASRRAIETPVG